MANTMEVVWDNRGLGTLLCNTAHQLCDSTEKPGLNRTPSGLSFVSLSPTGTAAKSCRSTLCVWNGFCEAQNLRFHLASLSSRVMQCIFSNLNSASQVLDTALCHPQVDALLCLHTKKSLTEL